MAKRLAHSLRELGDGIGRSHTVAKRWVEHPLWNQPRKPPWDVTKAVAWGKQHLGPNPADVWQQAEAAEPSAPVDGMELLRRNPLQAARLKLAVVRASKLELERAILAGEYVPRADVEQAFTRRVHAARAAFQALPRQLAGQLVGLSEVEIETILEEGIAGVLSELSRQPALPRINTEVDSE